MRSMILALFILCTPVVSLAQNSNTIAIPWQIVGSTMQTYTGDLGGLLGTTRKCSSELLIGNPDTPYDSVSSLNVHWHHPHRHQEDDVKEGCSACHHDEDGGNDCTAAPPLCRGRTIPSWADPTHNPYRRLFQNRDIPQCFIMGGFHLRILSPNDIDEDYAVISTSENQKLLVGIFGPNPGTPSIDWPNGVTKATDLDDLCWHYHSFLTKRSFAWVIRRHGRYVGCAYYFPTLEQGSQTRVTQAQVFVWFSAAYNNQLRMTQFYRKFLRWVKGCQFPELAVEFYTPQHRLISQL